MLFIKGKYKSKYHNLCLLKNNGLCKIRKNNGLCKNGLYIPDEWLNYGDPIL